MNLKLNTLDVVLKNPGFGLSVALPVYLEISLVDDHKPQGEVQ